MGIYLGSEALYFGTLRSVYRSRTASVLQVKKMMIDVHQFLVFRCPFPCGGGGGGWGVGGGGGGGGRR